MNKVIEVIVSPQGETRVETRGFTGNSCLQASQFIEQALGKQVGQQLKAEYHQQVDQQQSQRQQQQ